MDGQFYIDQRTPFISADVPSVTLTATPQALMPVANLPALGGNYFNYVGKAVRITTVGRLSTGATPGTFTLQYNWGTGASNNGTIIVSWIAGVTANVTNLTWKAETIIRCRTMGTAGTLFGTGDFMVNTFGFVMIPNTAPAPSAALDLTVANVISLQASRSGSTAESMQVHETIFEALN